MAKDNKGITLIALVITIIVLLILAGVSIAMLTGGNGLLTKAAEAEVNNVRGEVCDRINTALNACYAEILSEQYGVGEKLLDDDHGDEILASNGLDELKEHGTYTAESGADGVTITWTATDDDYKTPTETIVGKIVKDTENKEKKKVPYTVTAADIKGGAQD